MYMILSTVWVYAAVSGMIWEPAEIMVGLDLVVMMPHESTNEQGLKIWVEYAVGSLILPSDRSVSTKSLTSGQNL